MTNRARGRSAEALRRALRLLVLLVAAGVYLWGVALLAYVSPAGVRPVVVGVGLLAPFFVMMVLRAIRGRWGGR